MLTSRQPGFTGRTLNVGSGAGTEGAPRRRPSRAGASIICSRCTRALVRTAAACTLGRPRHQPVCCTVRREVLRITQPDTGNNSTGCAFRVNKNGRQLAKPVHAHRDLSGPLHAALCEERNENPAVEFHDVLQTARLRCSFWPVQTPLPRTSYVQSPTAASATGGTGPCARFR